MSSIEEVAAQIRSGTLNLGRRHYALGIMHGLLQAKYCGYSKIAVMEFGVGEGGGFVSMVRAADFFRQVQDIEIEVYGFDNGEGLPDPLPGYKDHPEIWRKGQFRHPNLENLKESLPPWANLIIGDIKDTIPQFCQTFEQNNGVVGFAAVDVDFYSSSVQVLKLFDLMKPTCYLPATPIYFDDMKWLITLSKYAGMELAIEEFNQQHEIRKIEAKPQFNIENLHVCHVFDHPVRTGEVVPAIPFEIYAKPPGTVHDPFGSNGGYII